MKIKKSSKFAKILFCALAVAMLSSIGAVAAQTYDSGEASHGMVGGTIYQYHSALYASSSSNWRAATWIQAADGKNVPAGNTKAKAFLYDRIMNPQLLVRRIYLTANHVLLESEATAPPEMEQLDAVAGTAARPDQGDHHLLRSGQKEGWRRT